MSQQVALGVLAVVAGVAVGAVLFVPFVALSYRRRGRLSLGRLLGWVAGLVYFWAIWSYTLLPLPDPAAVRCAGVNTDVFAFVGEIRGALAAPGTLVLDPVVLQLVLNVLLFLPLGFFLRVLGGRGIFTALGVGLAVSLLIETTQLTGVWGLYHCAYRVFDVDDLLTNTLGAVIGSVVAIIVPRRYRGMTSVDDAGEARPATRARRALAMLCDLTGAMLVEAVVVLGWRLLGSAGQATPAVTAGSGSTAGAVVAATVWFIVIMATGRSVGDLAVRLRYAGGSLPAPFTRSLRYVGGIGGYVLLGTLQGRWAAIATLFAIAAVVLALFTRAGRGLPGILSGQNLRDSREGAGIGPSTPRS